jgi:hypothetical protein
MTGISRSAELISAKYRMTQQHETSWDVIIKSDSAELCGSDVSELRNFCLKVTQSGAENIIATWKHQAQVYYSEFQD